MEVRVLTEQYRQACNRTKPHRSLDYRVPEILKPADPVPVLVGLP